MIDFIRKVFKWLLALLVAYGLLICLVLVGLVAIGVKFAPEPVLVDEGSALVLDLSIGMPDSPAEADPAAMLQQALTGNLEEQTSLLATLDAIEAAASDDRISALYIRGTFAMAPRGGSLAAVNELRAAVERFKQDSGKPVIAFMDLDTTRDYLLKSVADEVYINESSMLLFNGLAVEQLFLEDTLERLGVGVQVVAIGEYKSAGEMFSRSDMSEPNREQLKALLDSIWADMKETMAGSRSVTPEKIQTLLDADMLISSEDALEAGLVDGVVSLAELRERLIEVTGFDADEKSWKGISTVDYGDSLINPLEQIADMGGDKVAVIYAEGTIVSGPGGQEYAGSHRLIRDLIEVGEDDSVKAVVLRVNSPGGGSFASEQIGREVARLNEIKPVIVSFGGYAASGGYYIGAPGHTIFADPTTVTGSIGVVALYPNVEDLSQRFEVGVDGVQTTEFARSWGIMRPLDEQELAQMTRFAERSYDDFVGFVAESRGMEVNEVQTVARGRVWSGKDAMDIGLVDQFGGLRDAIRHAGDVAGLGDDFEVMERPRRKTLSDVINEMLESRSSLQELETSRHTQVNGAIRKAMAEAMRPLELLLRADDPNHLYQIETLRVVID